MLLVIDIGNTNTNLGVFGDDNKLEKSWNISSDISRFEDEYGILILSLLQNSNIAPHIDSAIISSVVAPLSETYKKALEKYLNISPFILSHKAKLPVKINLKQPKEAGADRLSFHIEATELITESLERIRSADVKAGIAICPETPIEKAIEYFDYCDFIVVMGVHPGFSGQKYIPETTERLKFLRSEISKRNLTIELEMDGGANESNVREIASAGADIIVSGSCAFNSPTPEKVIQTFRGID